MALKSTLSNLIYKTPRIASTKNVTTLKHAITDYTEKKKQLVVALEDRLNQKKIIGKSPFLEFEETFGRNLEFLQLGYNKKPLLLNDDGSEPKLLDYVTAMRFEFDANSWELTIFKKTKILNGNIEYITIGDKTKQHDFYYQKEPIPPNVLDYEINDTHVLDRPHVYIYGYEVVDVTPSNVRFLRNALGVATSTRGTTQPRIDFDTWEDRRNHACNIFSGSMNHRQLPMYAKIRSWSDLDGCRYVYGHGKRRFYYKPHVSNFYRIAAYRPPWIAFPYITKYSGYVYSPQYDKFLYLFNQSPCIYSKNRSIELSYFDFKTTKWENACVDKDICLCQRCIQDSFYDYSVYYDMPSRSFNYRGSKSGRI